MKKIKLTEETLGRIVKTVIMEQEKEEGIKQLHAILKRKSEGEDVEKELKDLFIKHPHLEKMLGALTPEGKKENIGK